ncbi:MAG: hypothetical protein KJ046_09360 [Anaerolineae bacterium]|nr:hypothetical protein [Anaerolineae bacterium]
MVKAAGISPVRHGVNAGLPQPVARVESLDRKVILMTTRQQPTAKELESMIITDVLAYWPKTADVFHKNAMACVGCAVASFYTILDSALVYNLQPENFIDQLLEVIQESTTLQEPLNE